MPRGFLLDDLVECLKMGYSLDQRKEAGVGLHFWAPHEVEEVAPVAIRIGKDAHITVAGAKRLAARADDAGIAGVAERRLEGKAEQMLDIGELRRGLEHRHL